MPTVKQEAQHAIHKVHVLCNFFDLLLIGERYGLIGILSKQNAMPYAEKN
jgi:hypothetical protein